MLSIRLSLAIPILAALVTLFTPARASGGDWHFELSTTFASQYLWRGFVLNDTPVLQPAVSFGYKGLSITSWSNFAHRGPNGQNWTEHDLSVDYAHHVGKLGLSAGYILYWFPDLTSAQGNRSQEFYAGVAFDAPLNPSFTFYRDVDQGDGNYFYLSGRRSWTLGKGVALNSSLGLGLNNGQWIDNTTISNFDVSISIDIPAGKVTFSPFFTQMIGHRTLFGTHNAFGVNLSVLDLSF